MFVKPEVKLIFTIASMENGFDVKYLDWHQLFRIRWQIRWLDQWKSNIKPYMRYQLAWWSLTLVDLKPRSQKFHLKYPKNCERHNIVLKRHQIENLPWTFDWDDFNAQWLKRRVFATIGAFWGSRWYTLTFRGSKPKKKPIYGEWIGAFKPNTQNIKTSTLSKLLHRFQPNFAQW